MPSAAGTLPAARASFEFMRFFRACLVDPWSGGLIAVTVALFVALQGLVGAFVIAGGPSHLKVSDGFVVCTLTGARIAPADPSGKLPLDNGGGCCCCCAVVSSHGKVQLAALLPSAVLYVLPETVVPVLSPAHAVEPLPQPDRLALSGPRAPPLLSA